MAFSRALKIEKLKAPLFPGPKGTVDTNDWCIRLKYSISIAVLRSEYGYELVKLYMGGPSKQALDIKQIYRSYIQI